MSFWEEVGGDDPDLLVRRLRRNAVGALVVLAVVTGAVTWRLGDLVGVALGGLLSLLSFQVLVSAVMGAVERLPETPGPGRIALIAGRLVLLALLLCGTVLLPGIRPIPVALGLSVLVVAIVIEALAQNFS